MKTTVTTHPNEDGDISLHMTDADGETMHFKADPNTWRALIAMIDHQIRTGERGNRPPVREFAGTA